MEFQVKYLFLLLLFTVTDRTEWFWMASLLKNIQDPFLVLHFSYYTLMTFQMILSVMLLSILMILLSVLNVIKHLIFGSNLNWFLNLNLIYETLWTGARSGLLISIIGKPNWLCLTRLITLVLLMWKMMDLFLRKLSFRMLGLTFSSNLDWSSYIISIAKTASKNIRALIRSMTFLSPEVALYFYKFTIHPCME